MIYHNTSNAPVQVPIHIHVIPSLIPALSSASSLLDSGSESPARIAHVNIRGVHHYVSGLLLKRRSVEYAARLDNACRVCGRHTGALHQLTLTGFQIFQDGAVLLFDSGKFRP